VVRQFVEIGANGAPTDTADAERLLSLLDGLPLAIAQAGAFLRESGLELETYVNLYKQQWKELMESTQPDDTPLRAYPGRCVWTTWTISYNAIRGKDNHTANLLLLWSLLDNKDLWHGLFATACTYNPILQDILSSWIGDIATSEVAFARSMQILRHYSLVEEADDSASYSTHPVVHEWVYHYQGHESRRSISPLAVMITGSAVPHHTDRNYFTRKRRILPHVQACSGWILTEDLLHISLYRGNYITEIDETEQKEVIIGSITSLGIFYRNEDKLDKAEEILRRQQQGCQEILGLNHKCLHDILDSLAIIYTAQEKWEEAEEMYKKSLELKEEQFKPDDPEVLLTVSNLGEFYRRRGQLSKAEEMLTRALSGYSQVMGLNHVSTARQYNNLGLVYDTQGKLNQAEKMLLRALQGYQEVVGEKHQLTSETLNNLGGVYLCQENLIKAEEMYKRSLSCREEILGVSHISTLRTVRELAWVYFKQNKPDIAERMFVHALQGMENTLGLKHNSTLDTAYNATIFYIYEGQLDKVEDMWLHLLQGYDESGSTGATVTDVPALRTVCDLGDLFVEHGELSNARTMYQMALSPAEAILGASSGVYLDFQQKIKALDISSGQS
jgi:tetratricopeptide (TPR) repeat protein